MDAYNVAYHLASSQFIPQMTEQQVRAVLDKILRSEELLLREDGLGPEDTLQTIAHAQWSIDHALHSARQAGFLGGPTDTEPSSGKADTPAEPADA